jgi:DNA polymerase-3 subunit beta
LAEAATLFDRDVLLNAARTISDVTSGKVTIPILQNLMIVTEGGLARIVGTDLDIQIEATIGCVSDAAIEATVSVERLIASIETLRGGEIQMKPGQDRLVITQGRSTRTLPTLPIGDFPTLTENDFDAEFEVDASALLRLFDAAQVAMANEVARAFLNGVLLHVRDGKLTAAATDMNRLVEATDKLPVGAEAIPPNVIIPSKAVQLMRKILRNAEEGSAVLVRCNGRMISFRSGKVHALCKLLEGEYPDYQRIIPRGNAKTLEVHVTEFVRSLQAAAALGGSAGEKTRGRLVRLNLNREAPDAIGTSSDGSVVEPIEGAFDDDEMLVGVNSALAVPVAQIFGEAAQLRISFADPKIPMLLTSPDKPALTAVVGLMAV